MKKKLLLFIIVIALSNLHAQNKGYVALSFGGSSPLGDFADKSDNNPNAGFAKLGTSLDLSIAYKLGKRFGMAAMVKNQSVPSDSDALTNYYEYNYSVITSATAGNWNLTNLMIGGYGSFPIVNKLSLESKLMIGAVIATSPEIYRTQLIALKSVYNPIGNFSKNTSTTYGILFNAGLKYDLAKRICLLLNLDYLQSNPSFTYNNYYNKPTDESQYIQTLSYTLGVGYRL